MFFHGIQSILTYLSHFVIIIWIIWCITISHQYNRMVNGKTPLMAAMDSTSRKCMLLLIKVLTEPSANHWQSLNFSGSLFLRFACFSHWCRNFILLLLVFDLWILTQVVALCNLWPLSLCHKNCLTIFCTKLVAITSVVMWWHQLTKQNNLVRSPCRGSINILLIPERADI
jgi:hypothetical protein